jgi:hypothetical protein
VRRIAKRKSGGTRVSSTSIFAPRRPIIEADFCAWVGQASSGDTLEYHHGFIAVDVELGPQPASERKALRRLARRAALASHQGLVHLVQRRTGPGEFIYCAIKRPRLMTLRPIHAPVDQPVPALDPKLKVVA